MTARARGNARACAAGAGASDDDAGDLDLVTRVRAGNAAAFETLFRASYASLRQFAERYVGSPDEARDVVHDVMLRVWLTRDTIPVDGSVRAYLFRAVRNGAIDRLRRAGAEARWAQESGRTIAEDVAEERDSIESSDRSLAVDRAVAALPERQRLVMGLRWTHGMAFAEIARVLGVSVRGVEQHHRRALAALRAALRPLLRARRDTQS